MEQGSTIVFLKKISLDASSVRGHRSRDESPQIRAYLLAFSVCEKKRCAKENCFESNIWQENRQDTHKRSDK
jgi:hypothetical protein